MFPPIGGESKSAKDKRARKSKKPPADDKKNALVVVEKIRQKTKTDASVDKVEVNVQRLLNLSKTNVLQKKLEKKVGGGIHNKGLFISYLNHVHKCAQRRIWSRILREGHSKSLSLYYSNWRSGKAFESIS